MYRKLSLTSIIFTILLLSPFGAIAQDSTPEATGSPVLGEPVRISGPNGEELGAVTVTALNTPYLTYVPDYPPIRGYHFAVATVTVENTGSRPLRLDPRSFVLQDTDGFTYANVTIRRQGDDTDQPDLKSQELAAGGNNSGVIGFQVLNGATLANILYRPDNLQMVSIMDFETIPPVSVGETITVFGGDNSEIVVVSVDEFIDPFDAYADNASPDRGSHYVMVNLTLVNSGVRPFRVDPGKIVLQDSDGFLSGKVNIRQAQDGALPALENKEIAPGETASGVIGFLVINGVEQRRVLFQPAGDRLLFIADLAG